MRISDLSFPPKVILGIFVAIVVGWIVYFEISVNLSQVRVSSPTPGAFIMIDPGQPPEALPVTIKRKPGRAVAVVGAIGYREQEVVLTFRPFRRAERTVTLEPETPPAESPLLDKLPYTASGQFTVYPPEAVGEYVVHILPRPSWYADESQYRVAYDAARSSALEWIRSQGVDPETLTIVWEPDRSAL